MKPTKYQRNVCKVWYCPRCLKDDWVRVLFSSPLPLLSQEIVTFPRNYFPKKLFEIKYYPFYAPALLLMELVDDILLKYIRYKDSRENPTQQILVLSFLLGDLKQLLLLKWA